MKQYHVILLVCFITLVATAATTVKKRNQIVDGNHFFSEQNKQKSYTITQLLKNKPVAVVIKPVEKQPYSNPITLTIKSGSKKNQCKFKSYQDLCVMDSAENDSGQLIIQCENLPCEVSWEIHQPDTQQLKTGDRVENLYKLPKNSNGVFINLLCEQPEKQAQRQDQLVLAFSNIKFQSIPVTSTLHYIVYDEIKQDNGYLYLNPSPKYKTCIRVKVYKGSDTLSNDMVQSFIKKDKKAQYSLSNVPDNKNFVVQIAFHSLFDVGITSDIFISITGVKNGQKKLLRKNKIDFNFSYKSFDLSYGVPKIDLKQWKDIKIELQTQNPMLLTEMVFKTTQRFEVQATQFSYFDLKAGEKLQYKLIQQKNAQQADQVNIYSPQNESLKISKASCNVKAGCQFEIQAIKDVQGNIYLGRGTGQQKQIIILEFGESNTFTHKVKQLESVYIKKKLQANKAVQVTINSPNVVVYIANTKRCPYPSQICFQKSGNINKHFIYYPINTQSTQVVFRVSALDTCQFTLTLLTQDTEYVDLVDSQPFVYLFDKQQQKLQFRFKRSQKVDVNFNLIGPLQALDLIVENGKKIPDDQQAKISTQGFLQFKAQDSPKNQFVILVRKRQAFVNKFVHFTLIASTKGKRIRLQSGITHYQTLTKSDSNNAEYIFAFDPNQDYFVNFYSHNVKQTTVQIQLTLRALENKQKDSGTVSRLTIDRPADALDLSQVSKQLCASVDNEDYCEISLTLQNKMNVQVDIAITLMSQHTILQLKDGLWQSFSLNNVAKTTHFYFVPRNRNDDINILYKTTDPSIRLKYRMFYGADNFIDPTSWPFPSQTLTDQQKNQQKKHKPINHFGISKSAMSECWPNCIVLVSVIDLQKKQIQGSFSLMASNSITQIPQKQKIDITLKQGQNKAYLIDLKYALDIQQNVYFYSYHSIGLTSIYANVYSQKNDRVPQAQQFDFDLSAGQAKIPLQTIKQIIKRQQMDQHINIYLYIVVQALSDAKVSIQFAFRQLEQTDQKLLDMDTFEHLTIGPNSQKIYYAPITQNYQVKIIREKGFPLYSSTVCKKQIEECLKQLKQSTEKGTQLLQKVAAYTATPCEKCIYIFKIKTQTDPADLTIHLQSSTSEIQLIQNKSVYDFTQKSQSNNYIFYAIRGQEIYVNIHITQGQIQTQISDLGKLTQKKSGKKLISFIIPGKTTRNGMNNNSTKKLSKQQKQVLIKQQKALAQLKVMDKQKTPFTQAIMTAFGLSDKFIQLHVSIKSVDPNKPSIYTISYSSGDRQFELQDGLITDYVLQPKKQTVFYYTSRQAFHIYFTISMQKSSLLKDLQITFKYCQPKNGIIDDDCWIDYKTDSPTIKDKVPHPTLVYLLVNKNYIAIFLTYNGDHSQQVSLGINHQQIMILPFNTEFPFILHSNQTIDFLVQVSNNGYIEIVTRKCDQSNPIFAYTFDYDAFQNNQFTYQAELGANPKSKFMSKVKQGILYMQMKAPVGQSSALSIMVKYSQKKIVDTQILPGNKGNLDYQIVDSSNGVLHFRPPTCPDSSCPKFKYYIMSAPNMRDLYSQLVCPSNFFTNVQFNIGGPVKLSEASVTENADGTLSMKFSLLDQISYVGIKASNGKDKQVFYKPIEVATFWGHLSRTSHSHKLTIASIFICAMVGIVIFVRRSARRGYKPIQDQI